MSDNETMAIILPIFALVCGWAFWALAVNIRRTRSTKYSAEIQAKLLDRFTNNQDLTAFLEGSAGRYFFESLNSDLRDSISRILNSVQLGTAFLLLGLSLLLVRFGQDEALLRRVLLILGTPLVALGVGLLISSFISHRLCKSWGLIKQNGSTQ